MDDGGLLGSSYAIGGNGKSIAISAYFISKIGENVFMLMWAIFGVVISYTSLKSSKVTPIISPWECIDFWRVILVYRQHLVSIKLAWPMKFYRILFEWSYSVY